MTSTRSNVNMSIMEKSQKSPDNAPERLSAAGQAPRRVARYIRDFAVPSKLLPLLMDLALVSLALYLALVLRFEEGWSEYFSNMFRHIVEILCVYLLFFVFGRVYDVLWRFAGIREALQLGALCAGAGVVCVVLCMVLRWGASRGALIIHAMLTIGLVGLSRALWRFLSRRKALSRGHTGSDRAACPRLMIVGAGMAGSCVMNMCSSDPSLGSPIVYVDDDKKKQRLTIRGVPVAGTTEDIPALVAACRISDIMIAIPSLGGEALGRLVRTCTETGCRVRISGFAQNPDEVACLPENLIVREPNISDFLSRDEVVLDTAGISGYLKDQTVLVSGGGGSIGSELCRQIMKFSPRLLIVFDVYENSAYELECELKQLYGADCPVRVLIGSVRDRARLTEVFEAFRPEVVFHAADGGQPRRSRQEQCVRNAEHAGSLGRLRGQALCAAFDRQGRQSHQRDGRDQAHHRDAHTVFCQADGNEVHGRALWKRSGLTRLGHSPF